MRVAIDPSQCPATTDRYYPLQKGSRQFEPDAEGLLQKGVLLEGLKSGSGKVWPQTRPFGALGMKAGDHGNMRKLATPAS